MHTFMPERCHAHSVATRVYTVLSGRPLKKFRDLGVFSLPFTNSVSRFILTYFDSLYYTFSLYSYIWMRFDFSYFFPNFLSPQHQRQPSYFHTAFVLMHHVNGAENQLHKYTPVRFTGLKGGWGFSLWRGKKTFRCHRSTRTHFASIHLFLYQPVLLRAHGVSSLLETFIFLFLPSFWDGNVYMYY